MVWEKKTLWLVILLFMSIVITAVDIDITRASGIRVSIDPGTVYTTTLEPGAEFSIDLTVNYIEKLWGYQFWLSFDPTVLHGVSVEDGPFLGSAGGEVLVTPGPGFDNENGWLMLFGASIFFMGEVPEYLLPTGGGVLATITFEVVGHGGSHITLGPETGLGNKTGGWGFDDEYCFGMIWVPFPWGGGEFVPYEPWLNILSEGSGSFDNRHPVVVEPAEVRGVLPNNNFTVSVDVQNMTDVYRWGFRMRWNATLLNVTENGVTEGDFLKGQPEGTSFVYEIDNGEGYVSVNCTTIGDHPGVDGSGTLAQITFLVLERGISNLTLYDTYLLDSTLGLISIRTANGLFNNLRFHNVAITSVTPYTIPSTAPPTVDWGSGEPIFVNVTVENIGDYPEITKVTVYFDDIEIGSETDVSLDIGASITFKFTWNTTNINRGRYLVSATVDPVAKEIDTADNTRSGGEVVVLLHDIAITQVRPTATLVYGGETAIINVDVKNEGTELEDFTVTVYYDGNELDTKSVTDFGYGASTKLRFEWDTTGVALAEYFISANATVVEGETDIADNVYPKVGDAEVSITLLPPGESFPIIFALIAVVVVVIAAAAGLLIWRSMRSPQT
jgi:hypothetical protein